MRVIQLNPLDPSSIDNAIKEVKAFQKWIEDKTKELLRRLAERGRDIADFKFSWAAYDGTNDVSCRIEERGEKAVAVLAVGNAVLFIEFGTGILYPDDHPENRYARGGYGKHQGLNPDGWRYRGDPGTNGVVEKNGKVHTYGNPANMSMYQAIRDVEREFVEIAKEVFV